MARTKQSARKSTGGGNGRKRKSESEEREENEKRRKIEQELHKDYEEIYQELYGNEQPCTRVPHKNKEDLREGQNLSDSYSIIFFNKYLAPFIFSLLPVSDLATCRQVSHLWLAISNDDSMWLQKYIKSAGIKETNVTTAKPEGYFRQMYLDRFGRDDKLQILGQNYQNTRNFRYLQQFVTLAKATELSQELFGLPMGAEDTKEEKIEKEFDENGENEEINKEELIAHPFFINKAFSQYSSYLPGSDGSARSSTFNAIATLYSLSNLNRVRLGITDSFVSDKSSGFFGNFNLLAYYDDSNVPEHLCMYVGVTEEDYEEEEEEYKRREKMCARVCDLTIEPFPEACKKLIHFLDYPATCSPKKLIERIGKAINFEYNAFKARKLDYLIKISSLDILPPVPSDANEKKLYYKSLAVRAQGEIQKLRAIKLAKKRNLKPEIIDLLEHTVFYGFDEVCGRPQNWLYGATKYFTGYFQLYYASVSMFELALPSQPVIQFTTKMKNPQMKEYDLNGAKSRVAVDDMVIIASREKPFPIQVTVLNDVIKYVHFPQDFSYVDLLTYVLVAGNLLDEYNVSGDLEQKTEKLCTLGSLEGIYVEHTHSNFARHTHYKHLKIEIEKLQKELNWDGHQPAQFTKWQFTKDDVANDDFADPETEVHWLGRDYLRARGKKDEKIGDNSVGAPYQIYEIAKDSDTGAIKLANNAMDSIVLYELTHPDKVATNEIVIQDKSSLQFLGGLRARSLLGIGNIESEITEDMLAKFHIWVAAGRYDSRIKLAKGTRCMLY